MARRTYRHIDYSPIAITLAARENWLALFVAAMAPHPSRRVISVIPATSPAPQRRNKNASTPVAATTTPRPSCKVTPTTVVVSLASAIRPPGKASISAIPTASPTP
ncbi:hypothetical protein ACLOJK_004472 [Asimina triloba]